MTDENTISGITQSASPLEDEYYYQSMASCVRVSSFLANQSLGKDHPKNLAEPFDACGYAEAVFSWEMNGKDPFWTYVTKDPVLLHYRKDLHARFELEILTLDEYANRERLIPGSEKLRFCDLFHPLAIGES